MSSDSSWIFLSFFVCLFVVVVVVVFLFFFVLGGFFGGRGVFWGLGVGERLYSE